MWFAVGAGIAPGSGRKGKRLSGAFRPAVLTDDQPAPLPLAEERIDDGSVSVWHRGSDFAVLRIICNSPILDFEGACIVIPIDKHG